MPTDSRVRELAGEVAEGRSAELIADLIETALDLGRDRAGVAELKLVVTDAGDTNYCDHADWAEATLTGTLEPAAPAKAALPQDLAQTLGKASVQVKENDLTVSTGRMSRTWTWNKHGLLTISLKDLASGRDYAVKAPTRQCDWDLPGAIGDTSAAKLISVTAREDDDSGFSTKHIEVVATIRYPQAKLEIQHVIWAFPEATGLRTQLRSRRCLASIPRDCPRRNRLMAIAVPPSSNPVPAPIACRSILPCRTNGSTGVTTTTPATATIKARTCSRNKWSKAGRSSCAKTSTGPAASR